jgi:hypothetical protein
MVKADVRVVNVAMFWNMSLRDSSGAGTWDAQSRVMKTSEVLEGLVRACADDERTLQNERRFVTPGHAGTLIRLARERAEFMDDLERLGARSQRRARGSWAELVREARRWLWVLAAGRNNGDAIASCRHSHARVEARYDEAMERSCPEEVCRVLAVQRGLLHDETGQLNQLQF